MMMSFENVVKSAALIVTALLMVTPTAEGCSLSPYPFATEPVAISVPVRVVPLTGYANDADCAAQILAAPIEQRLACISAA